MEQLNDIVPMFQPPISEGLSVKLHDGHVYEWAKSFFTSRNPRGRLHGELIDQFRQSLHDALYKPNGQELGINRFLVEPVVEFHDVKLEAPLVQFEEPDHNNPHQVTAAQIGLGNYIDFPPVWSGTVIDVEMREVKDPLQITDNSEKKNE